MRVSGHGADDEREPFVDRALRVDGGCFVGLGCPTPTVAVVLAGAYFLLDDRGVAEARAWVENHPTFDQVPQEHWQVKVDRTSSLVGRPRR
jgi:hypothetical protein